MNERAEQHQTEQNANGFRAGQTLTEVNRYADQGFQCRVDDAEYRTKTKQLCVAVFNLLTEVDQLRVLLQIVCTERNPDNVGQRTQDDRHGEAADQKAKRRAD